MEWFQQSSLLQPEDWKPGVLKFSRTPSIVFKGFTDHNDTVTYSSKPLISDEDWNLWLDKDHQESILARNCSDEASNLAQHEKRYENPTSRLALLICGRSDTPFRTTAVSHMPFSETICSKVVSRFEVHCSIARTINRKLNAVFSSKILRRPNSELPIIFYNCRSSANWSDDLALSVTYCPSAKSTKAVFYGCTEEIREEVVDRLSGSDIGLYHPLTLPALFAEIERDRHSDLVKHMVTSLMQRARNIATAHPPRRQSENAQPTGVIQEPENYMQQWFEITYLKNGLQSWRHELDKMVLHCDDLARARFYTCKKTPDSSESTPVNTALTIDVFASEDPVDMPGNEIEDLTMSGRRIRQRLLEIQAEYDDKIRECGMIIDGMVLAAQLEWNNIGQSDTQINLDISKTNLEIARSAREDGQQMRSIALLTMIFLPATFVASLFSMTFFDWNPEHGQRMLSPYIWMYVVVTAGLTGLTLSLWYFFGRPRFGGKADCVDIEGEAGSEKKAPAKFR